MLVESKEYFLPFLYSLLFLAALLIASHLTRSGHFYFI